MLDTNAAKACFLFVVVVRYLLMNLNPIICERRFFLWKLEYWWVFIDKPEFRPKGRIKLKGNWYWRT